MASLRAAVLLLAAFAALAACVDGRASGMPRLDPVEPSRLASNVTLPPAGYDKRALPVLEDEVGPIKVKTRIFLQNLLAVRQVDETLMLGLRIYLLWRDPRLKYDASLLPKGNEFVDVDPRAVWDPKMEVLNIVDKDILYERVQVFPDGTVFYMNRIKVIVSVDFDVRWYPFDQHRFHIKFESFGYHEELVRLMAHEDDWAPALPRGTVESFELSVNLLNTSQSSWVVDGFYGHAVRRYGEGSRKMFTDVDATLELHRGYSHVIMVYVMPMVFIVFTGAANFYFDIRDLEPRVTIASSLMLSLVALQYSIENQLPSVSYTLWINWYLFGCYVFLVGQVISFLIVLRIAGPRTDGTWTRKGFSEDQEAAFIAHTARRAVASDATAAAGGDGDADALPAAVVLEDGGDEDDDDADRAGEGDSLLSHTVHDGLLPLTPRERRAEQLNRIFLWGYPLLFLAANIFAFSVVPERHSAHHTVVNQEG